MTLLLEPYSYGFIGKLGYLGHLIRGMVLLRTSRWFIVDNAYLPIHVLPHRKATTVIQVWHAVGALKRFGWDSPRPLDDPERRFLHRHYDWVVCSSEATREPYAAAFRVPLERVVALGAPRVDQFADPAAVQRARQAVLARYPSMTGRRVVLVAPTFRGRGVDKRAAPHLDAEALRAALPGDHLLALKSHPNLDPARTSVAGFDLVIDPVLPINDVLTATEVLVTDYSSSIFEWAVLRRPLVLLVPDLDAYAADPGLYLDYASEMIGTQVADTAAVAAAILASAPGATAGAADGGTSAEPTGAVSVDAFIERHLGQVDGYASERFVTRFLGPDPGLGRRT